LKTIHMPLNLSQLQTVLPKSKYDLEQTIDSNQISLSKHYDR
jgi:hypothetical protein